MRFRAILYLIATLFLTTKSHAQRSYATHSVLEKGNWYKIGIRQEGVYKIDAALLGTMGLGTGSISSAAIRLYGNGGAMLSENNAEARADDLVENAIEIVDGGDGVFNGNDYLLFYAPGTLRWEKDSVNQRFRHRKNLYADTAFYFLTIGGTGKRITVGNNNASPATVSVNSFDERYMYENDLVNLIGSGKEWLGEAFSGVFGGTLNRNFSVDWPGFSANQSLTLISAFAARSVGSPSRFSTKLNGVDGSLVILPGISGSFLDLYGSQATAQQVFTISQQAITVGFGFVPGNAGAEGWLNWFELHGRRNLSVNGNAQLLFRDWRSVSPNNHAGFSINNAGSGSQVWDVTQPLEPQKMNTNATGSQINFTNAASRLKEYVCFTAANALSPIAIGVVPNQDLHFIQPGDFFIVTHPSLLTEANRLAQFHRETDGLRTRVVTTEQVYLEFAGGQPDPTAIRDFIKMFYDKAGTNPFLKPSSLLLFGAASYDYRHRLKGNTNLVPGYESVQSLDPLSSYTSDDLFGLLDDNEDINQLNQALPLDIGIGRIPARNLEEAKQMVTKIIRYHSKESQGAWRNELGFVADDGDQNLHLQDAESIVAATQSVNPLPNHNKIYLDTYPLVSGSGGARYPAVSDAIVNAINNGLLVFNYSGHGNHLRLADEAVVSTDVINRLNNPNKLPLFITASCDFYPFDDPLKNSLGALALTGSNNGAIALLTTSRLVFAFSNRIMNDNYLRAAFQIQPNGQYLSLGESLRRAKNNAIQNGGDVVNARKFVLLGDPAMKLAIPENKIILTQINGLPLTGRDTLKPLTSYRFEGRVTSGTGGLLTGFNGKVYPVVYDQPSILQTRGNDASSPVTSYAQQTGVLYKGSATVTNGLFAFTFIMPKDISFQPGKGRISLYAEDAQLLRDAAGIDTSLRIGGAGAVLADNVGPVIKPFLNDEQFRNGGLTHENPLLLVYLSDSSGINTSGNSIGHDITLVIDGNEREVQILNDKYIATADTYREGSIRYQLPTLSEGPHSLTIKAWDVANQSSTARLDFIVQKKEKLRITNLFNFPNPFQTLTTFAFEHNQPNTELTVDIGIYASGGQLVKRMSSKLQTAGTRNVQVNWEGTDEGGRKLGKGIYIYRVTIASGPDQHTETKQLILF